LDSTARNGKEIPSLVQTLASGSDDAGHYKVDGGSNPARENNLNQQDYCFNQKWYLLDSEIRSVLAVFHAVYPVLYLF